MSAVAAFPVVRLASLAQPAKGSMAGGPFGSDLVSSDYVSSGVPVVRGTNLPKDSKFSLDNCVFVTESKADALHLNCAHPGDLVFTQRGTLGQVGLIPNDTPYSRFLISQSQMKMIVDRSKADPLYIYHYFRLPSTVTYIENHALRAGVPHINLGILRRFEIICPPLETQQKIAAILSAYDDLIANNQRRITLLERMAEDIYREWFVRLRFPGHEQVSRNKGLPQGWAIKKLKEICDITYGFPFQGDRFNTAGNGRPIIRIRNIPIACTSDFTDEVADPKYIIRAGDLLIGMDGDFHINHWLGDDAYLVQRSCRVKAKNPLLDGYIARAIAAPINYFQQTIVGATVGHLGAKHLNSIEILVPSDDQSPQLELLNSLLKQRLHFGAAIGAAQSTRDALLPRLISGKLAVDTLDIRFPPGMAPTA